MNTVTVADVCNFYEANYSTTDFDRYWPRIKRLKAILGDVSIAELRRQQIWDCFSGQGWPYLRDSLEAVKRVFGYAVRPRAKDWRGQAPAPIISRFDNPLDGVVVNLKRDSANWKAINEPLELRFEMVDNSEAAWQLAQAKKKLE